MFTYICFARRWETTPGNHSICTQFGEWGIGSTFHMHSGFKLIIRPHLFRGRVRGERAESITKIEELNQFLQTGLY